MKGYITGANGFIGKHLVKKLTNEDIDLTAIPHEYIQTAKIQPFQFFYFLSSYGNLYNQKDDKEIYKANLEDVESVLEKIKQLKIHSFIYLSTSSVKLRTQTMYSRAKRAAEELLLSYMEKYDLPICIIRPYTVIGVGEHEQHLIPTLIDAAFKGKLVNFVSMPVHDYIDVDDFVNGVWSLSQHKARGIFELGTGKQHSNLEILQLVEAITGKRVKVNYVDSMRSYDTPMWVSTNFKARGYGWLPQKTLSQTILEMVEDYKKNNEKTIK